MGPKSRENVESVVFGFGLSFVTLHILLYIIVALTKIYKKQKLFTYINLSFFFISFDKILTLNYIFLLIKSFVKKNSFI